MTIIEDKIQESHNRTKLQTHFPKNYVCGQQKEKEVKKESQIELKESKFFTCHVRGTTDAKKKICKVKEKKETKIITLTSNKKKRNVPRDPQDNCHISNSQETIEAHGLQVHLHAHSQCTAISSNWSPSFLD